MKKTLSFILALVMLLGCMSVTAFAAETTKVVWDEEEILDILCHKDASGEMNIENNTLKGITVECEPYAAGTGWYNTYLNLLAGGTVTFTSTVGAISKIEISAENVSCDDFSIRFCPGWSLNGSKLTWQGEPAETVTLSTNYNLIVTGMSQIVFTIGEEDTFLTSFTLNKDYNDKYTADTKSAKVNETLTYTIAPVTANAPAFANGGVVTMNVANGVGAVDVTLPTVTAAGEYWYTLKENAGTTAGVTYDAGTYYLHLVTDCKDGEYGVVSAQIHSTAPGEDGTFKDDDKIDTISNLYAEGSLTVTQYAYVNGEHSSADEFTNEVTFKLPEGTDIAGNISYGDKTITPDEWQDGTVSVAIDLRDGDSVIFEGLPDGTTYTVKQKTDAPAMGYDDPIYRRDIDDPDETGDDVCEDRVEGTVSDLSDFVEIVNAKRIAIDVGVFLENGAFVVLAVGALAVGAWLVISRRKENDYSDAE